MSKVPTIHVPNKRSLIEDALNDPDFRIATKCVPGTYWY
ncbi:hypothetical protein BMETH_3422_0 [methanotrophic bacterial endosymbiont of Bathymodiolus sp.]|nr:hypothetical protein BMETH_3422_0 [methanotrophic bacterial endosymbiont of Bathymodiolus sp.]